METTIQNNQTNRQPVRSSPTAGTGEIEIPVEKEAAIGDVIDRWRLDLGWKPLDEVSHTATTFSWVHLLDSEAVPWEAYSELYDRAKKTQANMIAQGKECPKFGIELLLSGWLGPHGLKEELKQRRVSSRKFLTGDAESQCGKCFGSKFEVVGDLGARPCPNCKPDQFAVWELNNK